MILLGLTEVLFWNEIPLLKETINRLQEQYHPNAQNHTAYEKARDAFYKSIIPDKAEFSRRIDAYKKNGKPIWVSGRNAYCDDLSSERLEKAFCYASKERGRDLAERTKAFREDVYVQKILGDTPQKILELTVGAGGGTNVVARAMRTEDRMIGVDIDFVCVQNADAIGRHYGVNLLGMCCNLWQLPFMNESFSVVCCNHGLNECREVPAILQEAARVLLPGGKMVMNVGRNGYQMNKKMFELYNISEEEGLQYLKDARLYSTVEDIDEVLRPLGIVKIDCHARETGGYLIEYIKEA